MRENTTGCIVLVVVRLQREASQPVAVSPLMFDSRTHDYNHLAGGGGGGGRRRWRDLVAHEPLITEQHQGL